MAKNSRQLATSLFKALDLLSVLAIRSEGFRAQELVDAMNLPRSSVIRFLDSLIHYGFVARDSQRRYHVTENFREWRREDPAQQLKSRFVPLMRRVTDEIGELTLLGRLVGRRVRILHFEEPRCRIRIDPHADQSFPIESMAMGKLALSQRPDLASDAIAPETRKKIEEAKIYHYAWNHGETEDGVIGWATWLGMPSPLTPFLSILWPDFRFARGSLERAVEILREESRSIGPMALFEGAAVSRNGKVKIR